MMQGDGKDRECDPLAAKDCVQLVQLIPHDADLGEITEVTEDGEHLFWQGLKLPLGSPSVGCAKKIKSQAQLQHALLRLARGSAWDSQRYSTQVSVSLPHPHPSTSTWMCCPCQDPLTRLCWSSSDTYTTFSRHQTLIPLC
jgi:hypothetical protein